MEISFITPCLQFDEIFIFQETTKPFTLSYFLMLILLIQTIVLSLESPFLISVGSNKTTLVFKVCSEKCAPLSRLKDVAAFSVGYSNCRLALMQSPVFKLECTSLIDLRSCFFL